MSEGVPFAHAAVATDSIATAYHAVVTEAGVRPGERVVVVGLGGLGLNGVKFSALSGAKVFGVDKDSSVFDAARSQGAAGCSTSIHEVAGNVDVVIDFAGVGVTTADAVLKVRPGGRVILVGLGSDSTTISTQALITKNVQLRGSIGASRRDLEAVLEFLAEGVHRPVVEEVPFDELTSGVKRLERGEVTGRLFTRPNL